MSTACRDCNAEAGSLHTRGCDQERCARCGGQLISCGCKGELKDTERIPWSGVNPNYEACERLNLWCKWVPGKGKGWTACEKDDPEARPDLNKLMSRGIWSNKEQKFIGLKE